MSDPTNVTLTYSRTIRPADFESEVVQTVVPITIDPGENVELTLHTNIIRQRCLVAAALGIREPHSRPLDEAVDVEAPQEEAKPAKRKRRTKAEMANAPAPTPSSDEDGDGGEITKEITDEQLRRASAEAAGKAGSTAVLNLLSALGVSRMGQLDQEKRAEFVEQCRALAAG